MSMTESYLVVGGSSDIAQLLVTQLLEQGKQVTVLARDSSRVEHLSNSGVSVIIGDALDSSVLQSAIETAKENGNGSIAGAAHLVGSILVKPPHALKLDDFEEVIRTNLTSAFLSLSLICKAMLRSGGGRLVFTSSVAGSLGLVLFITTSRYSNVLSQLTKVWTMNVHAKISLPYYFKLNMVAMDKDLN